VETILEFSFDPFDRYTDYFEPIKISPSGESICILYGLDGANMLTLLRPDGTELVSMDTATDFYGGHKGQANWSPDGEWLVFTSKGDNTYTDIYMMDANGENIQQMTNNYAKNSGPYFSPSGQNIIYWQDRSAWIMNLESGQIENINYALSWTPNEQYYLYMPGPQSLGLRNLNTSENLTIYVTQNPHHYISETFFSMDGNWVLLSEYDARGETIARGYYNWYKINMNQLDQPIFIATARFLDFSYDGSFVLFQGWLPSESIYGEPKFYAIDLDGSMVLPLSDQAENLLYGFWLPHSESTTPVDPSIFIGPTPVPTWSPMPEEPVFDTFDNQVIDSNLWRLPEASLDNPFYWTIWNGELNIQTQEPARNNGVDLFLNAADDIQSLYSFTSGMKLWGGTYGTAYAEIKLSATIDGQDWWAQCKLGSFDDDRYFVCEISSYDGEMTQLEYMTLRFPVSINTWYEARIEVSPDLGALQFYLDGQIIGTYQPRHANDLVNGVELRPSVGVWIEDGSINASFDNVRISR
jgi:hypothetical protein